MLLRTSSCRSSQRYNISHESATSYKHPPVGPPKAHHLSRECYLLQASLGGPTGTCRSSQRHIISHESATSYGHPPVGPPKAQYLLRECYLPQLLPTTLKPHLIMHKQTPVGPPKDAISFTRVLPSSAAPHYSQTPPHHAQTNSCRSPQIHNIFHESATFLSCSPLLSNPTSSCTNKLL